MEITSRTAAIHYGEKTYFTGEPCKNGHIAKRYTLNGSCADCVNGYVSPEEREAKKARCAAILKMVPIRLRCYDVDLEVIKAAAWALALERHPLLTMRSVYKSPVLSETVSAGIRTHRFNCHPDDKEPLRQIVRACSRWS